MMNPFAKLFRARDKPRDAVSDAPSIFFGTSGAGKSVTPTSAMRLSAVYACVRVIAETIASLPLNVYEITPEELKAGHALAGQARQQLHGVAVFALRIDPALGREHFAHRPCRAHFKAQPAHGHIGHAGHGRETRAGFQFNRSDVHPSAPPRRSSDSVPFGALRRE